jgi:branched-chain amino acid transport system ATP-binding protein
MELLICDRVTKRFGGIIALNDVSLSIRKGEIVGLIGPNGAGKTTLFNVISGIEKPSSGEIFFKNKNLWKMKIEERAKVGISRTFQTPILPLNLTVAQSIDIVLSSYKRMKMNQRRDKIRNLLELVGLSDKSNTKIKHLTLAQQKFVEIARALAIDPELILLDEPLAGLNPTEVSKAVEIIEKINSAGTTIFWIEHVMSAIMKVATRIIVLDKGKVIAEGKPEEVSRHEKVITAYLGEVL